MSLINQLDYICTIYKETNTTINWTTRKTSEIIYWSIPCHFYTVKWALKPTDLSENTPIVTAKVIIEPTRVNVRKWQLINISIWELEMWTFEIDYVKPNPSSKWLDSYELQLKNT